MSYTAISFSNANKKTLFALEQINEHLRLDDDTTKLQALSALLEGTRAKAYDIFKGDTE